MILTQFVMQDAINNAKCIYFNYSSWTQLLTMVATIFATYKKWSRPLLLSFFGLRHGTLISTRIRFDTCKIIYFKINIYIHMVIIRMLRFSFMFYFCDGRCRL